MIRILFFGRLRELLRCNELQYELSQDSVSLSALRLKLREKGPEWDEFLSATQALSAVNQTMADDSVLVKNGDEVAFFPPVTGG